MAGQAMIGRFLGVAYRGVGGPRLFHIRYVSAAADNPARPYAFAIRTPDGDEYEENYDDAALVSEIALANDHRSIAGVPDAEVYPFRAPPSAADEVMWKARGAAIVAGILPGRLPAIGGASGANVAQLAGAMGLSRLWGRLQVLLFPWLLAGRRLCKLSRMTSRLALLSGC